MNIDEQTLERLREICLALPQTKETTSMGQPCFKAGSKTYAVFAKIDDQLTVCFRVDAGDFVKLNQQGKYLVPRFCTKKDFWLGQPIKSRMPWKQIESLVRASYRIVATKKMLVELDE